MRHATPNEGSFYPLRWDGLLTVLLAFLSAACGRLPAVLQSTPTYQTEVMLTSLDCDVVMWRRIFFHDEHDTVVAQADSGPPLSATDGGCTVHFSVALPKARSYVVDNGTRRSAPVSFDELQRNHFQMRVPLR